MHKLNGAGIEDLNAIQALQSITQAALQNQYSFALWKLPHETTKNLIVDLSGKENKLKPDISNLPPGFLVSPFLNEGNEETTYVKADLHYQFEEEEILNNIQSATDPLSLEKFEKEVSKCHANQLATTDYYIVDAKTSATRKEDFVQLVRTGVAKIAEGKLEKVVPSKIKVVAMPDNFDYIQCFTNLCEAYPEAMVSIVAIPNLGTWIGATPEILVNMDKSGLFKTVSLAGTQRLPSSDTPASLVTSQTSWTQKEIEEQALVSRYIINCFKKIRLREYEERGPKTIKAGNLLHLKTEFSVDTKAQAFPELPSVMLELLHPTSAVCGMPRGASLTFLKEKEAFDRQLYSGYLGPVNIMAETSLFVNLRCMQLLDKQIAIYAGAGVTADSDPEKEWQETELKCETLLTVLTRDPNKAP